MYIIKQGKNYYWYHSHRINGKRVSGYIAKATEHEYREWKRRRLK